ncbi:hypothetical protein E2C01_053666 [Portunus trituberculatus]|uniref:Uncharacterized protein n=1 Tax=Portunus trituberculatus TaxID=210409 RepID=A0A5B7GKZ4_PORTR|nr:hypothetical protein [Portunus trituberculatus]
MYQMLDTKTMEATNNNFDTYITVTCSTCGDSDIPGTPRHLVDDAGKERDLTELNCRLVYELQACI